jgi:hypothetical protein
MEHLNREDLIPVMYTDDDDEPTKAIPLEQSGLRSRKIRVGAIDYEVPTVDYVRHLEQSVMQQAKTIDYMRREITRMNALLHGTRNFVRRQTDTISDMHHVRRP